MSTINGAADRWRQWGFTWRTQPETINPEPHQPQTNQAHMANQPNHDHNQITGNQHLQANGDNETPNPAQTPSRSQIQPRLPDQHKQNNPPTPPQTNKTATMAQAPTTNIPTKTNPLQDSYLSPWGDQLQQPKQPNTIQICLQNFGGWPTSAKHHKNDNIRRFVNSAEADVLLTTENNITWHKLTAKHLIIEHTRGWWESLQVNTAHNTTDPHTRVYQLGGVGIFSINRMAHRVHSVGCNPTGLNRYCWTVFYSKDNKRLRAIATYRPSKSNNGHLSITQQHWRYFMLQSQEGATVAHPRTQFWKDLKLLLQAWSDDGKQILIGLDAKEKVNQPEITASLHLSFFSFSTGPELEPENGN